MRNAHGLAFDGHRTVLFDGAADAAVRGDTWGWDGRTWTRLDAAGPSPRTFPVMVPGEPGEVHLFGGRRVLFGRDLDHRDPVLRFGGWDGRRRQRDTWRLLASGWQPVTRSGPAPRNHSAMAFDARRDRFVLIGGHDGDNVFGDLWELADRRWVPVGRMPPRRRVDNGH